MTDTLHWPALPADGRTVTRSDLTGSALACWLAHALPDTARPVLILCRDNPSLERLEDELRFYGPSVLADRLARFPDGETLPYDNFSPHEDIVSDRLSTLHRLRTRPRELVVLASAQTLLQRLVPTRYLDGRVFLWRTGERLDATAFRQRLNDSGYRAVTTVREHGEFAVRGALLDVYPMGSRWPVRVDLFDNEIESLRTFDPETQRTRDHIETFSLLPAREYPLNDDAIRVFRQNWHEQLEGGDHRLSPVYQSISEGRAAPGAEAYLPLFFTEDCATLLDFLPDDALIVEEPGFAEAAYRYWAEIEERYGHRQGDRHYPPLPPEALYLFPDTLFGELKHRSRLRLRDRPDTGIEAEGPFRPLPEAPADGNRLERAVTDTREAGRRCLICAETPGRREVLQDSLRRLGADAVPVDGWAAFARGDMPLAITVHPMDRGLALANGWTVLTEPDLFPRRVFQRRRRQRPDETPRDPFRDLGELRPGQPVVHLEHGVGRFLGLEQLTVDDQPQAFMALAYADDAKLYVPVTALDLISRYSGGDPEHAPLHRLGSDQWDKARRKALKRAEDVAAELLAIQAEREARGGVVWAVDRDSLARFAAGFPFETTPDQEICIQAVLADLAADKPMDRLVCGDVGFGKTEVALRAAHVVTQNDAQVCVLVPTTLLAQQHFETFRDRFADWPIRVELMSRFRNATEQKALLADLANGRIDIVIGTHRLLQKDTRFRHLGLVVIDEEHRFGVRHKERLKALRAEADLLTLTATPIPRTLNMTLSGLRDISIIASPPPKRLGIKTFVRMQDPVLVREAVLREVLRGGQVYYLSNRVADIERTAAKLRELVPEATIGVAHGQMTERQLEQVMADFYHRHYNVLVCTTIIESGIDVPNANTMIIQRADRLGLAQLHQLRGRVGRSHHQAYAYLMVEDYHALTADAEKRLAAIAEADTLGAGFALASRDLEIRGAGELLGREQSGQIESVGLTLYLDMLASAARAIRTGEPLTLEQTLKHGPEIQTHFPALIPDTYVPDVQTRLQLYKRMADLPDDPAAHESLQVELIDRFGLLPDTVRHLLRVHTLKPRCVSLGIERITTAPDSILLVFHDKPAVDPTTLVSLVQAQPDRFRLTRGDRLRWQAAHDTPEACLDGLSRLLDYLGAPDGKPLP